MGVAYWQQTTKALKLESPVRLCIMSVNFETSKGHVFCLGAQAENLLMPTKDMTGRKKQIDL